MRETHLVVALDDAVRLVTAAAARLDATTPGIEHPRIDEARLRLSHARDLLTVAMRTSMSLIYYPTGFLRVGGVLFQTALLAAGVWAATQAVSMAHGSTTWMILITVATVLVVAWPASRLTYLVDGRIGRRRVAAVTSRYPTTALPPGVADIDRTGILLPIDPQLDQVRGTIDAARSQVGAVARLYLDGHRQRPRSGADLGWLQDRDNIIRCIGEADISLCQASDAVRIWTSLPRG